VYLSYYLEVEIRLWLILVINILINTISLKNVIMELIHNYIFDLKQLMYELIHYPHRLLISS